MSLIAAEADSMPSETDRERSKDSLRSSSSNRDFNRLVSNLPLTVLESLSDDQLVAIEWALKPTLANRHYVDFRSSVPILRTGFYLVVLAGREKRSKTRLRAEGQNGIVKLGIVYSVIFAVLIAAALFGLVVALYIGKSALGIDITEGPSFLHQYFYADSF